MSWVTTRMTLSVGDYRSAKKSGFNQWAKVICHVSPINPTTNQVISAISQSVEFWPDDQAVAKLMLLAKNDAEEISIEGKEWKRWVFTGEHIPDEYRDMFSFMGELAWNVIDFGQDMVKVMKEDGRIVKIIKDADGKPVIKRTVVYAYWYGPMISPGLTLSKEYREARVRRDYEPLSSLLNLGDNQEENDNGDDGGDNNNDDGGAA